MAKRLSFLGAVVFLAASVSGPATAQMSGEVMMSAVVGTGDDLFKCRRGRVPCNLRVRIYNQVDPTDFFGAANPVDGYPQYHTRFKRYFADSQLSGNYLSGSAAYGLSWFAVWDGVTSPDVFNHVGYYGAQSQILNPNELGNALSTTCVPVSFQTACFMALSTLAGNDLSSFGPAGVVSRYGGLSPIPRPTVISTSLTDIEFVWEEAAAVTINDGAQHPILGYKLLLATSHRLDRFGPTDSGLAAAESLGLLIDTTPGSIIPRTTTNFTLSSSDPILSSVDLTTESLVAVIKLVYAGDVPSSYYSSNAFPAAFVDPLQLVGEFRAQMNRGRAIVNWRMDGLAGIRSFQLQRSSQLPGPYHRINSQDIPVDGARGTFVVEDRLDRRVASRGSTDTLYYRLEIETMSGTRVTTAPVAVPVELRRR